MTDALSLTTRLAEHFAKTFDEPEVCRLSRDFRDNGYVKVSNLVPADVKEMVTAEVYRLQAQARRIDIRLRETGNSPRSMSTVGQRHIEQHASVIPDVYHAQPVMDFLGRLAGERVLLCPWEEEKYVIIRQERKGDTHGWHWGDFPFTVIWVIETPPLEYGGMLQCIPHTRWDKANPRVHQYLVANPIRTYALESGDIYFLRSDITLHRTVPLTEDRTRIILNTCWAGEADMTREKTHETMEAMFE
jgi:hypothetical protein